MKRVLWLGLVLAGLVCGVQPTQGQAPAGDVMILNTYGIWRFSSELAPPVLADGRSAPMPHVWLGYETSPVTKDWMSPDFNDQYWHRGPVTLAPKTAMLKKVCLRGKFEVTNVGAVKGLKLSVGYHGGLVVYVNGKEVARAHVEAGKDLADGPAGEDRELTGLAIANGLLRKGVNVIGLEVVRSPQAAESDKFLYDQNSCQILSARLTAESDAGLVPSAVRPEGFQVWNADTLVTDFQTDFGNPSEALRPVVIMGARNGMFTGKVVAGSTKAIQGLKVTPGELKGQGGSIPGTAVAVRYGVPWGYLNQSPYVNGRMQYMYIPYTTAAVRLGALAEKPLAEFPVLTPGGERATLRRDAAEGRSADGAVVPIWLTVKVPATAGAGIYTGTVRVEATGEKAGEVPVELHVADWTLPDTQVQHTFVDLIQCPDTSAMEYNVPLWSEKHWEMIAQSFKLIGQTGSRTVYIPLICHTNLGNEESLVRWVKKGEDKFDYDFSLMDKYLDVATKAMGKPKQVIFVVWDVYMIPAKDAEVGTGRSRQKQNAEYILKKSGKLGGGPMVTVVDPATQKTELAELPTYFEAETSRALWKPLLDKLRAKMKARGLEDAMMLGLETDVWATKEELALFNEMSGNLPWVMQSHEGTGVGRNTLQYGIVKMGYQDVVWMVSYSDDHADRGKGAWSGITSHMGWARPDLVGQFDRFSRESCPSLFWMRLPEATITGGQRGNGRLGADYWPVIQDKRGRRVGRSHDRYPESTWRNLFIPEALLAPGPEGPVASDELEAFRQGIQECEARIVLEYGLDRAREKMGEDLAKRCETYLAKRHMEMWLSLSNLMLYYHHTGSYFASSWRQGQDIGGDAWYLGSGHELATEELFRLAGEVTKKIGPLPVDVSKQGNWGTNQRDHTR